MTAAVGYNALYCRAHALTTLSPLNLVAASTERNISRPQRDRLGIQLTCYLLYGVETISLALSVKGNEHRPTLAKTLAIRLALHPYHDSFAQILSVLSVLRRNFLRGTHARPTNSHLRLALSRARSRLPPVVLVPRMNIRNIAN